MNIWTNPVSAPWESPSWSLRILPASNQTVTLTNAGYKAVGINSTTFANFPASLTVSNLVVAAPTNGLNTLLLNYTGLGTPFRILNSCSIGTNGIINNLYSNFEVDGVAGGSLLIDGGTFMQVGGFADVKAPVTVRSGSFNSTNANMTLGEVTLGAANSAGNFNQDGGSPLVQKLSLLNGSYTLASGILYALDGTHLQSSAAQVMQSGGTNYGDVELNGGYFNMSSGMLQGNLLSGAGGVTQPGNFLMTGGVLDMKQINWSDTGGWYLSAYLRHGIVRCGSLHLSGTPFFYVEDADVLVTNEVTIQGNAGQARATLETGPCRFRASSVTVLENAYFWQDAGTNLIGSLTLDGGSYILYGGTLETPSINVAPAGRLAHEHGLNRVHGLLTIDGQYELTGGDLITDALHLSGSVLLWGPSVGLGTFTNNGILDLGGSFGMGLTQAWGGQLRLSADSTLTFLSAPAQLRFAPSSTVSWTSAARLIISNWNNSANIHLYFGNNASGLNASQLSQITFANPGGFPSGNYPAQLLSTGELVPAARPLLQFARIGSTLVLTWSSGFQLLSATNVIGPYTPVPNASSPWTNSLAKPQEFFELQGL
ncbi:MAG: hypothetical protein ACTHLW_08880 [Verrucomicrobiota bacterium]